MRAFEPVKKPPTSQPEKRHPPKKKVVMARPWYKRWWVWAIVGTVAATTAGVAIGVSQSKSGNDGYQFVFKY